MQDVVLKPGYFPADIFDHIRDGYRFVAARARHVRINEDCLKAYAVSLQPRAPANTLDEDHHYVTGDREALASYILSLEAVNFGSGYEEAVTSEGWARQDNSLYFTIAAALKKYFEVNGPWTASQMQRLTVDDVQALFHLPHARYSRALAVEFTASLNEMGIHINDGFDGLFLNFIERADGQAARMVAQLTALPCFQDVHNYQGRDITIFKRAQHATASLHNMFGRIGHPLFADIDRLTIFADNAIPQVLRMDGILEYTAELSARIESGTFIPSGSEEEIEIRCCAAAAMERLAALKGMRPLDLDYLLWHRSVEDPRYESLPPHRTLTRFY